MSTIPRPVPVARSTTAVGVASLVFLASKATAFLAPMLLARALPVADYGRIELALAWGTPSAVLVGLGLQGAVPYFLLKLNRPEAKRVFFLHVAAATLLLGVVAILCHTVSLPEVLAFALLIAAIFNAQNIYAAFLKSESRPALASFMEVAVYCFLFVYASAMLVLRGSVTMGGVYALLLAITLGIMLLSAGLYGNERRSFPLWPIYQDTVVFGMPLILTGLLNTVLLSGGKILIGALLGVGDVAIFSLVFRMVAAAVLVHQLPTTIMFAKLYKAAPAQLNRYLGAIQGAVLVTAITAGVVGWPVGRWLFPLFRENPMLVHPLLIVVALQMFYWCAAAGCEFIFYRENCRKRYAVWLCCTFLLLVGGTYALKFMGMVSLMSLARWQMATMYATAMGSMSMLWRLGIRLPIPIALSSLVFASYWIFQALHYSLSFHH